jgi:soluble lytic murein transglycosylase
MSGQAQLKAVFEYFEAGNVDRAWTTAGTLPDRAVSHAAKWLIATSGRREVRSAMVAEVMRELPDWPGQNLLRIRFEQAFLREEPDAARIVEVLGAERPATEPAVLRLARALVSLGREAEASELIRTYWIGSNFSEEMETAILAEFGTMLAPADHRARMDRLFYAGSKEAAVRSAALINPQVEALAEAWEAINIQTGGGAKLNALPETIRTDPAYMFARATYLRIIGRPAEAAAILENAPTDPIVLVDPEAWSAERREIARRLVDRRDYETAYEVIAAHPAEASAEVSSAEWLAGWIALRFLDDPARAATHFATIEAGATLPQSLARAAYWLGRAAEASGDAAGAAEHYQRAARYPTSYYGQLAAAAAGMESLAIVDPPAADAATIERFRQRELVRAIDVFVELDHVDNLDLFFRSAGAAMDDPAEVALLIEKAESIGRHQAAVQVAVQANNRGVAIGGLAFPTDAIPELEEELDGEIAPVYAIARQETVFRSTAVSGADARGVLQLLPGTAREVARSLGLPFDEARLLTDPAYNALLGGTYIARLRADYEGSYALAFTAYNAGPSRVTEWMERNGDPRDSIEEAVDWVELIPFDETRNYVQRTVENLQVYRFRLGTPELRIEGDLLGE